MHKDFWVSRWAEGQIGFHRQGAHPDLVQAPWFLLGGPHRVLVPLCGKSHDLVWLAEQGHGVVGVEIVEEAVRQFFEEQGRSADRSPVSGGTAWTSGRITIVQGDAFEVLPTLQGITRIWDRAALVALPPAMRAGYARLIDGLVGRGAGLLLNSFSYDQTVMDGPPFSVPEAEVRALFAARSITVQGERDLLETEPRWRERGHSHWIETLYRIEAQP